MHYRRELDGLRALAVLPVILFHAGFKTFSGGFVGVDVFFVISGYLIATIILTELEQGKFSFVNFCERRARRILPALFLVMSVCIPFAWFWLLPSDMRNFSQSLVAVLALASNVLFWRQSGYFDAAAELKPLLHTWSLAVEAQFYVAFPLFLMFFWKLGKARILVVLGLVFLLSLLLAQWAAYFKPAAAFYLLFTRGWELLIGVFAAFYLSIVNREEFGTTASEVYGWLGIALIFYSVLTFDKATPFPGFYALVPTVGAILIIFFATPQTTVGKFLGNNILVGIGLISYGAYLWHQPVFVFAKRIVEQEPGSLFFGVLSLICLILAMLTYRYVEVPIRKMKNNALLFLLGSISALFLAIFGSVGIFKEGYAFRFNQIVTPERWPPITCHEQGGRLYLNNALVQCLGSERNGRGGDFFLLGDSHAAQLTFPLSAVANEKKSQLFFFNPGSDLNFPRSFFKPQPVQQDYILNHLLNVADKGDYLILTFHRGLFNDEINSHLPLSEQAVHDHKYYNFLANMGQYLEKFKDVGIRVLLVKDTPLLNRASSIEDCVLDFNLNQSLSKYCVVSREQDLHTRSRQSDAFDYLKEQYPSMVFVVDPIPVLYGASAQYRFRDDTGRFLMFDSNHLTVEESLRLTDLLRSSLNLTVDLPFLETR